MKSDKPRELSEEKLALVLNLPVILLLGLLIGYPIAYVVRLSLSDVTLMGLRQGDLPFTGITNFVVVFRDSLFVQSLVRTVAFGVVSVTLMITVGLLMAIAMNMEHLWISRITRTFILLPWAVPSIANAVMWSFIFNPRYGHLNGFLLSLGLIESPMSYLGRPAGAMIAVIVAYVWRVFPFSAILLHASLQGISKELYEAADVDGATRFQSFWKITMPMLQPIIAVLLVIRTVFALTVFDEVYALTRGGPGTSTWTAAYYSYYTSFSNLQFGLGSTSALVLSFVIFFLSYLYIRYVYTKQV